MFIRSIVKMYEKGNVLCCGLRGTGKDMLTANVIARRGGYYVSNVNYKSKNCFRFRKNFYGKSRYIRFNPELLRVGNSYKEFLTNQVKSYVYPYPDGTDIYISDAGVYFPSQDFVELNRQFKDIPTFLALSRHLGNCNVHVNSQAINRVWDKIREQSETYIMCRKCIVLGKFVIQQVRIYEKLQSAIDNVPPCRVKIPILGKDKIHAQLSIENYRIQYGVIKSRWLFYINKSDYDTRIFKTILEGGGNYEE